jgi:tetraprenyl-beta-curcumene synthase
MGTARDLAAFAAAFVQMACRYWLNVFPCVCREARYWTNRAARIPDPLLRRLALESLEGKRGNIEGAAAFAALVPHAQRALVVRMLVAWQAAYDYLDTLAEQPSADQSANGRQLHLALLAALEPGTRHRNYYAHHDRNDDGGYLEALIDAARAALGALPSHTGVAASVQRSAARIVSYQSLNQGDHRDLARWADTETPPGSGLYWWETAAAGSSSLPVLALLTAAADAEVSTSEITAIECAYFPWIGGLHTLLDSLVDLQEDADAGQTSLLAHYASAEEAATRVQMFAAESLSAAHTLRRGRQHTLIITGMTSFYLTDPEGSSATGQLVSRSVIETLGPLVKPSMIVLRARRAASRIPHPRLAGTAGS